VTSLQKFNFSDSTTTVWNATIACKALNDTTYVNVTNVRSTNVTLYVNKTIPTSIIEMKMIVNKLKNITFYNDTNWTSVTAMPYSYSGSILLYAYCKSTTSNTYTLSFKSELPPKDDDYAELAKSQGYTVTYYYNTTTKTTCVKFAKAGTSSTFSAFKGFQLNETTGIPKSLFWSN
jgi:hypothetical protein